ncbi:hypothetical protein OHR68_17765 [Spirillospora sp. NBC_00431]
MITRRALPVGVDGGKDGYWHPRADGGGRRLVPVDCGDSDSFAGTVRRFRDRFRPEGAMTGGCHDGAFWQRRLRPQLAFLGHHLAGR